MKGAPDHKVEFGATIAASLEDIFLKDELRHTHATLPVQKNVQDFYYYNSGDFMNGMLGSFLTNISLTLGSEVLHHYTRNLGENNPVKKLTDKFYGNHHLINVVSGLISSAAIIFEETQGYFSRADANDIPAGIAGAVAHMALRYISIKKYEKQMEQTASPAQER